jgi:hypothetical protein
VRATTDAAADDYLGHADGNDADHRHLQDHHDEALLIQQEALSDKNPPQ